MYYTPAHFRRRNNKVSWSVVHYYWHRNNNLKLFPGTHQTMIGSEKSKEHRQRNEKICDTPRKYQF